METTYLCVWTQQILVPLLVYKVHMHSALVGSLILSIHPRQASAGKLCTLQASETPAQPCA